MILDARAALARDQHSLDRDRRRAREKNLTIARADRLVTYHAARGGTKKSPAMRRVSREILRPKARRATRNETDTRRCLLFVFTAYTFTSKGVYSSPSFVGFGRLRSRGDAQ